jgi:hypothetical protein
MMTNKGVVLVISNSRFATQSSIQCAFRFWKHKKTSRAEGIICKVSNGDQDHHSPSLRLASFASIMISKQCLKMRRYSFGSGANIIS